MANIQALRRRIRSIQGTTKIVRAMEMVATAKMRRTQQRRWQAGLMLKKFARSLQILPLSRASRGKFFPY